MKKNRTPTAVTSAVFTLITIFFWAGFEVYRAFTIKQPPTVPQPVIEPLDPTLDAAALDSLSQRLFFEDTDIGSFQVSPDLISTPVATVLPTPTETPVASPSSTPLSSPIPTATASATP